MVAAHLSASHWTFIAVVLAIVLAMVLRRGVTIISIVGILALAAQSSHAGPDVFDRAIYAVQGVFRAMLLAGTQLFDIILLIAVMLAMLRCLQAQGVDEIMVAPLRRLMKGPRSSFFVLVVTMYFASAFFWPSPAVALIGTVLLPVSSRAGLSAMAAAVAINMAGHGMALSADPVIQAATRITAGAAGVPAQTVFPYTLTFSLVVGVIAVGLAAIPVLRGRDSEEGPRVEGAFTAAAAIEPVRNRYGIALAILVPTVLLGEGFLMIWRAVMTPDHAIYGGDATALLGGTAVALLILANFAHEGHRALEGVVDHLTEGFAFAVRIFAPVIPIFAFFLLGDPENAAHILGSGAPGFMLDIGTLIGRNIGGEPVLLCLGITLVACICGIDGSGFAGLPLVGALSGAVAAGSPHNVAILSALGQVASIWVGGGTVVPWSGVCVAAGVAGVSPEALARRNLIPVMLGLLAMTALAVMLFN
ncbi:MAG TPA: hypothetical protein VGC10_08355 [Sphingomonas sp.]